jgi:hypothetical protein
MEQYWMDEQDIWSIELVKPFLCFPKQLESKFVSLTTPKLSWINHKRPTRMMAAPMQLPSLPQMHQDSTSQEEQLSNHMILSVAPSLTTKTGSFPYHQEEIPPKCLGCQNDTICF